MKVLHVVAGDLSGGAAKGAYILHKALLEYGVDSKLLVQYGAVNHDSGVIVANKNVFNIYLQKVVSRIEFEHKRKYKNRTGATYSPGKYGKGINKELLGWADIVHLHWINKGMISLTQIANINKPIVWTIRDMWPFTGGCHYSVGCEKYELQCGACPVLGSEVEADLSRQIVYNKLATIYKKKITFIGISSWLSESFKKSFVYNSELHTVKTIYNSIDIDSFRRVDARNFRKSHGIDNDKKIILCGAISNSATYKGFHHFVSAAKLLSPREKYCFVFFGKLDDDYTNSLESQVANLGYLTSDEKLCEAYSAADVFVAPSIQEGFGKTIVESMACGTPVVCFNATAPSEIVTHMVTGYTAKPFDPIDLKEGVEWVLSLNVNEREEMSKRCIEVAKDRFAPDLAASKYTQLYESLTHSG